MQNSSGEVEEALPPEYLPLRFTNILLSLVGIVLCSFTVSVIQPKYRATRDAFEFGLVLLQCLHIAYCGLASTFMGMDVGIRFFSLETQPALTVAFHACYSLTSAVLILKNLWTLCVSCFRCAATLKPLAFRTFLTVRFQLVTFAFPLAIASASLTLSFVLEYAMPEASRYEFAMNYALPLTRVAQSYVPIVGVVLAADVLAVYLCMYRSRTNALASEAGRRHLHRQSIRATCIVLSLSISFAAFEAPGAIFTLVKGLNDRQRSLGYLVNDNLVSLDSVFNFLVFFGLSENFRSALLASFRRCTGVRPNPHPDQSRPYASVPSGSGHGRQQAVEMTALG